MVEFLLIVSAVTNLVLAFGYVWTLRSTQRVLKDIRDSRTGYPVPLDGVDKKEGDK